MKTIFYILLFMVLFNIAAIAVAYTNFFGSDVLYGDLVSDDPTRPLDAPDIILEKLWFDPVVGGSPRFTINVPFTDISLDVVVFSWSMLTIGMLGFALAIGKIMHATPSIIAAAMVGSIFLLMYTNSKKIFESIVGGSDAIAWYLVAMFGVAFFFIALITIMDYLSGQNAASGR